MKTRDLELYKQLHMEDNHYGSTPGHHFDKINNFINIRQPKSILDFGCGKGNLAKVILQSHPNIVVHSYDPAIKGRESIPMTNYDMVITTDVLEHLYEDEVSGILEEILELNPDSMYHIICHRLAHARLPDGTNAHKTIQSPEWWADHLREVLRSEYILTFTSQGLESGYFEIIKS